MFPSQGQGQPGPGNLEDRLRGLILNNTNPNTPSAGQPQPSPHHRSHQGSHIPPQPHSHQNPQMLAHGALHLPPQQSIQLPSHLQPLPPHLQMANPVEQAAYLAQAAARSQLPVGEPPAKAKRPNQAQRRQMNSQMSIPIDPRPTYYAQAGRSPGYGHPQSAHYNQGYQNRTPAHQQQFSPRYQNSQPSPHGQYPHAQSAPPFQQSFQPNNMHQADQPHQPGFTSHSANQFSNGPQLKTGGRPPPQNRQLFQPGGGQGRGRQLTQENQDLPFQVSYLEKLVQERVPKVGIGEEEENTKEEFRSTIEKICQEAIAEFEKEIGHENFDASSVQLQCFGSMKSGFATKASDMDLALLAPQCVPATDSAESRIPRLLEKKLLGLGYGARLLTRTRVPIIKLCQKPTAKLLADLVEERTKWDNGATDEDEHVDEDKHAKRHSIDESRSPVEETHHMKVDASSNNAHSPAIPTRPISATISEDDYHHKLSHLKQGAHQSLNDYHNSAKRLLRRLGGRDVTANSPDLTPHENQILDDVCKAFILGLASEEMSARLQKYKSIQKLFNPSDSNRQRTLQGILLQADGERFVMAWDKRPFLELYDRLETEAALAMESWLALQDKHVGILEPAFYGRQLFSCLEKLKKINSLQIMLLEQLPHEEPAYYFARTRKLHQSLRTRDPQNTALDFVSKFVVEKYIAGVTNPSIREALKVGTLAEVNREHVRLQLASDYERALDLKIFDVGDVEDVKNYISILQHSKVDLAASPVLMAKMKKLPDPTQVSMLKPRDPYKDKLEFPKTDIGIQCDINFSAHLAIHNTELLRCYSACDPRVREMVLFVKHWAKARGINTPYRGTLSSYGYVLMVLHYLVNVAQPFVCPNLQLGNLHPPNHLSPAEIEDRSTCAGRDVRFWRNESEIKSLADKGMLNHNKDPVGFLLRGFFEYYAQMGQMTTLNNERGFDWGREVLSLRTRTGLVTKHDKGWTGAKTTIETSIIAAPPTPNESNEKATVKTMEETKEIRHRYLFAIEDPFEHDHNVARTVTHNGIVSIRDEFRRAWRLIREVGKNNEEELLDPHVELERKNGLKEAMEIIHGT